MEYRRPIANDFEQMVELQNKNLVSTLEQSDKADGFLSAAFSAEQFHDMDKDLCVVVCTHMHKVCGYLCATSIEYNETVPLVATMLKRYSEIHYQGKTLAEYQSAICGPLCIDKEFRGQNILLHLYNYLSQFLRIEHKNLELLITCIANDNGRSINANKKLGAELVGEFEFNKNPFSILVYPSLFNQPASL